MTTHLQKTEQNKTLPTNLAAPFPPHTCTVQHTLPCPFPLGGPVQDKAMYAVGQLISGNSLARSALFFYALLLHAVIFLILARLARAGSGGLGGTVGRC